MVLLESKCKLYLCFLTFSYGVWDESDGMGHVLGAFLLLQSLVSGRAPHCLY